MISSRHLLIGSGVLALTLLSLTGCSAKDNPTPSTTSSTHTTPAPHTTTITSTTQVTTTASAHNAADLAFVTGMIPHHEQAITMAELATTKASSPEVKQLAEKIKAAQGPEIATMKQWLAAWSTPSTIATSASGMDHTSTASSPASTHDHSMDGMQSQEQMRTLGMSTGLTFDRLWLQMMIDHHKGALSMAATQRDQGANPDAKALAVAIITGQQAEIDQMNQLLPTLR